MYASLSIQVSEHLFPDQKLFALSPDQRRIVNNETQALLVQARWVVDSKAFADNFATVQVGGGPDAPKDTVLGEKTPEGRHPGQYA